jgi:hypothetical protein
MVTEKYIKHERNEKFVQNFNRKPLTRGRQYESENTRRKVWKCWENWTESEEGQIVGSMNMVMKTEFR